MLSKILLKRILYLVGAGGIIFSFVIIFFLACDLIRRDPGAILQGAIQIPKNLVVTKTNTNVGLPVRLKILSISVDALVEHVGVTQGGEMGIPKGPNELAWFEYGPRPGEIGSAVISGHYGWKNNLPAVFDDLHKLQKGDKVYTEDDKGVITTFVVSDVRSYDQNASAAEVFGSNEGGSHLNLITCEGVWNSAEKSYSKRLVVFTDKVDLTNNPATSSENIISF